MKPKKGKKDGRGMHNKKYSLKLVLKAYELAREGVTVAHVATALGVTYQTFNQWRLNHPFFRYALKVAYRRRESSFLDYIYKRMTPKTRDVWDEIRKWNKSPNRIALTEALFHRHGKEVRQEIWCHAFIQTNFNASEACRITNTPMHRVTVWQNTDPNFGRVFEELKEHKKNFFESALIGLVKEGDAAATIFANRTINRDRGYNDKVEVKHTGSIAHNVTVTHSWAQIAPYLSLETKKAIAEACTKAARAGAGREQLALEPAEDDNVIELSTTEAQEEEILKK